jgi:pyruvate,orthophosphate dikinase
MMESLRNQKVAVPAKLATAKVHPEIYSFGDGAAEGSAKMHDLLGGKGANLAEMAALKLPVPPGFTISTRVCTYFYSHNDQYPKGLDRGVKKAIARVEETLGRKFGDRSNPLLVSVRAGARVSMPGMMDTVLNLGLTGETVEALAQISGNPRFAWDCYRRLYQMYGDVVLGLKPSDTNHNDPFAELIESVKRDRGVEHDTELDTSALKQLTNQFHELMRNRVGRSLPQDPWEQLWEAISAVFRSWNNARAVTYRRINNIPEDWGTAVTVQAMVFGNLGPDCATGVAFTRNPSTGERGLYGEYLLNAQGEDVVAGIRTPRQIGLAAGRKWAVRNGLSEKQRRVEYATLEEVFPEIHSQLVAVGKKLERHFHDMQDIEFTVERRRLFILQTRAGKRTGEAAMRIAVAMSAERMIDRRTALMRVEPAQLEQLLHPRVDPSAEKQVIACGLPASPGAASGEAVFSASDALAAAHEGRKVILVRSETSPEDIHGMEVAEGILTARGGMTSHAAVVARGMGRCCVVGCAAIQVDPAAALFKAGDIVVRRGEAITLDGSTGEVILGRIPTIRPELPPFFRTFMSWADHERRLGVRANADTPGDVKLAREFGAEGIGLCRTEHMFFGLERIDTMREMILAETSEQRAPALDKILPMQREDFVEIFRIMDGSPVTVRLLDPPLHEFLPKEEQQLQELAARIGTSLERLRNARDGLMEFNPMMGWRGARLGISYPEIYRMQARAIFEAAGKLAAEGLTPVPEIMLPLIGDPKEFEILAAEIRAVADQVFQEIGRILPFKVGTMIEVPRACLLAEQIARSADFFSFGTNDLTQMTYGLSRDDAEKFLGQYLARGIYPKDPFQRLDPEGVGGLIRIAVEGARRVKKGFKIGICGEHAGDPESIQLCRRLGLDYVSCSPYRIPVARLAATRGVLEENRS